MISTDVRLSRFPVGSSASRIAGPVHQPRAIATRCCCPPDNCEGGAGAVGESHACQGLHRRLVRSSGPIPAYTVGNSTFSSAEVRDSRLNCWNTKPNLRVPDSSRSRFRHSRKRPRHPGSSALLWGDPGTKIFITVDLPSPKAPSPRQILPGRTSKRNTAQCLDLNLTQVSYVL